MAAVHEFDGGLLLCASSSVFLAKNTHDRLSVNGSFTSKGVLRSILSTNGLVRGDVEHLSNPTTVDADVQILCSTISNCQSLLAVGTSEKVVIILEVRTLTMRRSFRVPKAPTSITFDKDDSHIVVGDRAGHVRRYTVEPSEKCGYMDMNGGDSIVIEWDMESGKAVSQSGKLDEQPVRRIIVIEKVDETFFVVAAAGPTLHVLDKRLQSVTSIKISQTIMDIAFVDGSLIGVSKFGPFDGTSSAIEIPNEIYQALLLSKDPISNYFKNVVHQNTLDYYKRKAEKLGSIKVNLKRKRKAANLLGEVEDEKRFT
uniref:Ribosome biogenesis protein NSA1 n=1 Tax=Angiostrongylus cantonensis TaxID=6313 RepID=A0A0K0DH55_ANGCA